MVLIFFAILFQDFSDQHVAERVFQPTTTTYETNKREDEVCAADDEKSIKAFSQQVAYQQGETYTEKDYYKGDYTDHSQSGDQFPRYVGQAFNGFQFPQVRPGLQVIPRIRQQCVYIVPLI